MAQGYQKKLCCAVYRAIDDSMEPRIAKGSSIKLKQRKPEPGDYVVVRLNGRILFREIIHKEGYIILTAEKPRYPALRFTQDEWKAVEIVGVMSAFETPRGT